jgi:hypothetical protein
MATKEKARANGPIPNAFIYHDTPESKLSLQASQLTRRCAITAAMAAVLCPFVFGESAH